MTAPAPAERFADFAARLVAAAETFDDLDEAVRVCTEELARRGMDALFAEMPHNRRDYLRAQMHRKGRPGWKHLPRLTVEEQFMRALDRAMKALK